MPEAVSEAIRRDLAILSRRTRARVIQWTPERPTQWQPQTVRDPSTGDFFTREGAWLFVADLLEKGHPIEIVTLDKPAGKQGFVMHVALGTDLPRLYIKVELGCGTIYGRSFHYDE